MPQIAALSVRHVLLAQIVAVPSVIQFHVFPVHGKHPWRLGQPEVPDVVVRVPVAEQPLLNFLRQLVLLPARNVRDKNTPLDYARFRVNGLKPKFAQHSKIKDLAVTVEAIFHCGNRVATEVHPEEFFQVPLNHDIGIEVDEPLNVGARVGANVFVKVKRRKVERACQVLAGPRGSPVLDEVLDLGLQLYIMVCVDLHAFEVDLQEGIQKLRDLRRGDNVEMKLLRVGSGCHSR
mmetsp:Transcript_113690/g.321915  ORF Transcript_113690/g.321915 Transcript_113690/m.321915 type:complete len:234 (+) Transcript_113690:582-1283(+)